MTAIFQHPFIFAAGIIFGLLIIPVGFIVSIIIADREGKPRHD